MAPVADALERLPFLERILSMVHSRVNNFEDLLESDGRPVQCLIDEDFENWGRTVKNTPYLTCFPQTIAGVSAVVNWAKKHGKQVRVSGYRHTWTDLYSSDDQVLICLLPLHVTNHRPAVDPPIDSHDALQVFR